uniref:Uncharacterized protein n=1 Tax=Arundo donax TaxID=35708 RepID=A0A0A9CQY9_ARUDO
MMEASASSGYGEVTTDGRCKKPARSLISRPVYDGLSLVTKKETFLSLERTASNVNLGEVLYLTSMRQCYGRLVQLKVKHKCRTSQGSYVISSSLY